MKYIKPFIFSALLLAFSSAQAAGEVVVNCSGYGPAGNGQITPGWAITSSRPDFSCGAPYGISYTWVNLNGYGRGKQVEVCGIGNLPNWWPVQTIPHNGGIPCYGSQYRFVVEYRGN